MDPHVPDLPAAEVEASKPVVVDAKGKTITYPSWHDPLRSIRYESLIAQCRARRTLGAMGHTRRRHTPEQIVRKLRQADRLLGEGQQVALVAKQLEVSEQTLHRWRLQYGGLKADDPKALTELERENARLKRLVADQLLENQVLKEFATEKLNEIAKERLPRPSQRERNTAQLW
jgi:putative transposase